MARFRIGRIFCALVCGFLALPAWALSDYRATYDISVRGVNAGRATYEVRLSDHSYQVETQIKPSLAAKMLGFGKITEQAYGEIEAGHVLPKKYQRTMEGDSQYRLVYDYKLMNQEIEAQIGNTQTVLKYDEHVQPLDILALIVQSLLDEEHQRVAEQYSLINEDKIRTYSVAAMPNERWQTHSGEAVDVVAYKQTSGNRRTKIYFANHPLRLVKLVQYKDDEARFSLKLINYQIL